MKNVNIEFHRDFNDTMGQIENEKVILSKYLKKIVKNNNYIISTRFFGVDIYFDVKIKINILQTKLRFI